MDDNCNVYLRKGFSRVSGRCYNGISSIRGDGVIWIKVANCNLSVVCSGPDNTKCVRTLTCANSWSQIDDNHDWNKGIITRFSSDNIIPCLRNINIYVIAYTLIIL